MTARFSEEDWILVADWLLTALANAYDKSRAEMVEQLVPLAPTEEQAFIIKLVGRLP